MSHQQAPPTSRRLIPFACAGDAAVHTEHHMQAAGGADPKELDDQVAEMDRDVATEEPRPAAPRARPLAQALGYPPLCAHGMNSFTDRDYRLALARLRRA